ncbi:hypothetical protein CDAR_411791 [Caerostris darwini]|uniref:Uncharacterized protein n=1 Tax=Caerostris darwini TaxID=1538125 RepID=A0AAV4R2G4_9ARAC|nr:hypothetical protein CDAR_411791 [Caerostris darwini]
MADDSSEEYFFDSFLSYESPIFFSCPSDRRTAERTIKVVEIEEAYGKKERLLLLSHNDLLETIVGRSSPRTDTGVLSSYKSHCKPAEKTFKKRCASAQLIPVGV